MTHEEQGRQALKEGILQHGVEECWDWDGLRYAGTRNPCVVIGKVVIAAHIAAWEMRNGRPVPEGKVIRHGCENMDCFNPAHMFIRDSKQRRKKKEA